jgi:dephospho-CoA kinase
MKVIGLTGGIGSGKSTVSRRLIEKGYQIFDADLISHQIVEPGMPALEQIRETFGEAFLDEEGRLRRKAMAAHITADPAERARLNAIMHTAIVGAIEEGIKQARKDAAAAGEEENTIVFIDAPLLFEAGLDRLCDEVWLVTAPEEVRIRRVMERDGISEELVRGYMASQMPEEEKRARSQRLLDNGGTREQLYEDLEEALAAITAETAAEEGSGQGDSCN